MLLRDAKTAEEATIAIYRLITEYQMESKEELDTNKIKRHLLPLTEELEYARYEILQNVLDDILFEAEIATSNKIKQITSEQDHQQTQQ